MLPPIDFSQILLYEKDDSTDVKKELACVGGVCEIDDVHTDASVVEATIAKRYAIMYEKILKTDFLPVRPGAHPRFLCAGRGVFGQQSV